MTEPLLVATPLTVAVGIALLWWRVGHVEKEQVRQRDRLHRVETLVTALLIHSGLKVPADFTGGM